MLYQLSYAPKCYCITIITNYEIDFYVVIERKITTLTRRRAYRDGIIVVYMNECYLGNYPLIQTPHLLHVNH